MHIQRCPRLGTRPVMLNMKGHFSEFDDVKECEFSGNYLKIQ